MDYYENDFEETMLKDIAAYFSSKASYWLVTDSFPVYMLKIREHLQERYGIHSLLCESVADEMFKDDFHAFLHKRKHGALEGGVGYVVCSLQRKLIFSQQTLILPKQLVRYPTHKMVSDGAIRASMICVQGEVGRGNALQLA
ncbi:hypothetical protein KSP39_PZI009614 [Platanthera zijinensis]|uniref:Uncharacterized protein n=1 Tax=Platanthera zijinensis TaxID=2320716 RepID=A0AAP0BKZ8_9ASPA